jgi:hypothetical protein
MQYPYPNSLRRAAIAAVIVSASAFVLAGLPETSSSAAQAPAACANSSVENGSFETPLVAANT